MPRRVLKILVENFEIEDDIVVRSRDRLGFSDWMALHALPMPALKDAPFVPRTLWDAAHHETSVFDDIREQDRLVHHPFDSFSAVETFIRQAVDRSARRRHQDDALPDRPELAARSTC